MNIHLQPDHPMFSESPIYADEIQIQSPILVCLDYSQKKQKFFALVSVEKIMDGQTEDNQNQNG